MLLYMFKPVEEPALIFLLDAAFAELVWVLMPL